jgi:hypothetical protein
MPPAAVGSDEALTARDVAYLIMNVLTANAFGPPPVGPQASGWGGWMSVQTNEAGHRRVERLLALLRRGDSGLIGLKGAPKR